jgi:integrase
MAIMGWSSVSMATRYQHVLDSIRKDVAKQVGGLLWENSASVSAPDAEEDGDTQLRPVDNGHSGES